MKLHCILLTLAVVNVSPIMTAEYANAVYLTNKYIEKVFDANATGLETAISNIVNGNADMVTLGLMLAVPETANIFNIVHGEGEEFIENLPETIAIADQLAVRKAIQQVTNIDVPQFEPYQIIENDSLPQLGEDRRLIIGKVAKKLLFAAIERAWTAVPNHTEICRLQGLLRSMRFPDAYIITASVSDYYCTLTSQNDSYLYIPSPRGPYLYIVVNPAGNRLMDVYYTMNEWFP